MLNATTLMERVFERADAMGLRPDLSRLSGIVEGRLDELKPTPPSTSEFEQLCRGLAVDPSAMYSGIAADPARSPARFRASTSSTDPSASDVRLLALAAEQGRVLSHLLTLLGRDVALAGHRSIIGVQANLFMWQHGYELGERARRVLQKGEAPVQNLPALLSSLGVHVAFVPLSSKDIHGASIWEPGAVPILLINSKAFVKAHPGALRATLAHELCHLLHDAGERSLTTIVSWGQEGSGNYNEALEARARAFAPAFLAPPS